ncbi:MAG: VCBS repeat-containing protein [Acidobacteriota bacterium]
MLLTARTVSCAFLAAGLGLAFPPQRDHTEKEAVPPPVPPVYSHLKDLHLTTALVTSGEPRVTIIVPASGVYEQLATDIQRTIREITGITVPVAYDDSPEGEVPIQGNVIALGNRSTNSTIGRLYDLYYCILDQKYPGAGGYNVRTLHSPFGDGRNVVLIGASDTSGVEAATELFLSILRKSGGKAGELRVGHLMEIRLAKGTRIEQVQQWDVSKHKVAGQGLYGWNKVSEDMAMYYMTGDQRYAREMLLDAFPDEQRRQELHKKDLHEYLENPLAETWEYRAHLMNLFWDLIEESPVFSDNERLEVTNAIARQLLRRKNEVVYWLTPQRREIGKEEAWQDMHSSYSALCLYTLGRYFQKDYPDVVWEQCLRAASLYYTSVHEDTQFARGADNLQWYNTEIEPVLTYMILTGWRDPLRSGAIQKLLNAQEALISGLSDDWALEWASPAYLNKAAYLTQDGRWGIYRDRIGLNMQVFRVGQSFWPEEHLKPHPPTDLVGKWNIYQMPDRHRRERKTGFAAAEAFYFGSFRSATDATGDFILIDGYNGEGRNPYHALAISELRMDGHTVLRGYRNQVLVSKDGLMEPRLAMDGALKYSDVVGDVAAVVAEVPQMSWAAWRRTLAQRVGRYAIVIDDVTFRASSDNMAVETLWETTGDTWRSEEDYLENAVDGHGSVGSNAFQVHMSDLLEYRRDPISRLGWHGPAAGDPLEFRRDPVSRLGWYGSAATGDRQVRFSLIARRVEGGRPLACLRVGRNAAALALPGPALAVAGVYDVMVGETVLLAEDHLFGHRLTSAGLVEPMVTASRPVDLMWDFTSGSLAVVTTDATEITLRVDRRRELVFEEEPLLLHPTESGAVRFVLPMGRHRIGGALPTRGSAAQLSNRLLRKLEQGKAERARLKAAGGSGERAEPAVPTLRTVFTSAVGSQVADLKVTPSDNGLVVHAAAGKAVHRVLPDGTELAPLLADGDIRVLAWWPERRLVLTGSTDDRVIAFDDAGHRKWVFVSEKDPRSYGPGDESPFTWLTYWPKLTGIHGLHTGTFLNGQSQAFVGSTNTLDIIDEYGKLVKRLPALRGMVHQFALVNGKDGRNTLLLARQPSDWDTLTVIDNLSLRPEPEGFHDLPPGHRVLWAWMQNRPVYLNTTDIDGDGNLEVVAAIDGVYNRISVWDMNGAPLSSVTFPPGEGPLYRNLPGVEVSDLDGDGRSEIVVATAGRMLVALNHHCALLWSQPLPATPSVLRVVPALSDVPAAIVVGDENGSVVVFDSRGRLVRQAVVKGRPTHTALVPMGEAASVLVIGTDSGQLAAFSLGFVETDRKGETKERKPTPAPGDQNKRGESPAPVK